MVYRIWIPRWRPPLLNELMGKGHWGKRHRLKAGAAEMVAGYGKKLGVPLATTKRRLDLFVVLGPRRRAADSDAYDKSIRDALVVAGYLKDDSPRWLAPGEVTQRRPGKGEEWGTLILLEDIPDEPASD